MNLKLNYILIISTICCFCANGKLWSQNTNPTNINGIWQSEGYGRILTIDDQEVQVYDLCRISCTPHLKLPRTDFEHEFIVKSITESSLTLRESRSEYDFTRLEELPELCQNQVTIKKEDPLYNFETLCANFEEHYCYFDTRKIDWSALKAKYQAQITSKTKPFELFIIMDKLLESFNEGHVTMFVPDELQKGYAKYQKQEFKKKKRATKGKRVGINTEVVRHALVDKYVKEKQVYNYGSVIWGMINDDLVLVQINGMSDLANYNIPADYSEGKAMRAYEKQAEVSKNYTQDAIDGAGFIMDEILTKAANAKAIILDMRLNGGGYDGVGMEILRRFIDKETNVLTKKAKKGVDFTRTQTFTLTPSGKKFDGKVFILTSPYTASAAESFTLASIEAIPDAIRIGDNTNGIFSDMLEKKLPNGWTYSLSNEVYQSMDGISYEGVGIEPHHKIPFEKKGTYWVFRQLKDDLESGIGDKAVEMILKMDLEK